MKTEEGVLVLRPLFKAVTDVAVRAFEEHRDERVVQVKCRFCGTLGGRQPHCCTDADLSN